MIIAKTNPVAQDVVVARIQKALHNAFDVKWSEGGNTTDGIVCYPRCYIGFDTNMKRIIDYYEQTTEFDYLNILDNEQNKVIPINDYPIIQEGVNTLSTKLDLIFVVDLKTTNPTVTHRADEEVRSEVLKVLQKIPNTSVVSVIRGLHHIFKDMKYNPSIDMQPKHCFKVVLSIDRFSENEKYC